MVDPLTTYCIPQLHTHCPNSSFYLPHSYRWCGVLTQAASMCNVLLHDHMLTCVAFCLSRRIDSLSRKESRVRKSLLPVHNLCWWQDCYSASSRHTTVTVSALLSGQTVADLGGARPLELLCAWPTGVWICPATSTTLPQLWVK